MPTDIRVVSVLHDLLSHLEAALGRGPHPADTPAGGPLTDLRQRIAALDDSAPQPTRVEEKSVEDLQTAAAAGDEEALHELVRRASAPAAPPATSEAL